MRDRRTRYPDRLAQRCGGMVSLRRRSEEVVAAEGIQRQYSIRMTGRRQTYQLEAQPCNAPRALRTIRATRPRQVTDPERRWLCMARRLRRCARRLTRSSRSLSATRRERRMPPGGLTDDVAFRRPAMRKGNMHGEDGVVVPRVATELVKAWSIGRDTVEGCND